MSETPDREDRTEEASEKKKSDALEKGQTAISREAAAAAGLAGVWASVALVAPLVVPSMTRGLAGLFEQAAALRLDAGEDAVAAAGLALQAGAPAVLALALAPAAAAILGHLGQAKPRLVWSRVAPDWSKASPASGWRRMFGREAGKQAALTTIKIAVALSVLAIVGAKVSNPTLEMVARPAATAAAATLEIVERCLVALLFVAAAAGGVDLALSRLRWLADLRMTKHEVKEEARQAEGDPHVKQRVRSIRMQRARRRMIAAVPRATFVVANPTHYAIAMRYMRGETPAPVVVAKGVDHMALTIRRLAEAAGVPVIEDKALARSMYDQVSVDQLIPAAFYPAVAELVHMLSKAAAERSRPRVAISAGAPIR